MVCWKKDEKSFKDSKNDFKNSELDLLLRNENITQLELAEALDVTPKTLRNYIQDPSSIPLKICDKLCNLFNLEFNDLFRLEKCDLGENLNELLNDEAILQSVSEIKKVRKSYIEAFEFYSDVHTKGFELFKKTILERIHKPLITMIGTEESDMNSFASLLLQESNCSKQMPVYYLEKDDLHESMRFSETLVIKTNTDEPFDVFLLSDKSYINKIKFEPYDPQKKYTEECILIKIIEAKLVSNCILLVMPNLLFEDVQRKTQLQKNVKKLSAISIYYLIKYIPNSDIILYFETSFKFFSVERTQLIDYLIDNSRMRYGESQVLFVETKCKKEDITVFYEKKPQAFDEVLGMVNKDKSTSNKKQFYDGSFSYRYYDKSIIPDPEILNCIEHLCLDFDDVLNLMKTLYEKINDYVEYVKNNSAACYFISEKAKIKNLLQTITDNNGENNNEVWTIEEQKKERWDFLTNSLEKLKDLNTLMGFLPENISDRTTMLSIIRTLAKKTPAAITPIKQWSAFQFIFNNILIPYFLLEMTFSVGNKKNWSKKIQEEISIFKAGTYYNKIENLISIIGGAHE